ncbi:MAG: AraC family transcriptional regulator [Pseudomonadota bacterium]
MDVLTDILRSLRLAGGVYFRCEFRAPWGMGIGPQPVAEFHVVVRGSCWLRLPGQPAPIPLHGGDLAVFLRGDPHELIDAPESEAIPAEKLLADQDLEGYGPVAHGGGGALTTILCGYFKFDRDTRHPLLAALPPFILIRGADSHDFSGLKTTLDLMLQETKAGRPGAEAVVDRLAEALFILMLRAYIQQSPAPPGMLAALTDRQIAAALAHLHRAPEQSWTLVSLAARVGMSRSALAARFKQLVGQPPMEYLTLWRMQKARELLAETRLSTAVVAEKVGYRSEAAFGKVFKKITGIGPGAFRRQEGTPVAMVHKGRSASRSTRSRSAQGDS